MSIRPSLRLLQPGLENDAFDVGIDVLVSRVEVANHDSDNVGSPEFSRRAEALFDVFDF